MGTPCNFELALWKRTDQAQEYLEKGILTKKEFGTVIRFVADALMHIVLTEHGLDRVGRRKR